MSIANDVKSDLRAARKLHLPGRAVLPLIIFSFLCAWLFDHFGKLELTLPALNAVIVLGSMMILKRRLWSESWFWITMGLIAAVHALAVLLVPWSTKWIPAMEIAAFDWVDILILIWLLSYIGRFIKGKRSTKKTPARSLR